jgi:hypothetical protein
MSGRTWLMMILLLGLNWGGFIAALVYGAVREGKKGRDR